MIVFFFFFTLLLLALLSATTITALLLFLLDHRRRMKYPLLPYTESSMISYTPIMDDRRPIVIVDNHAQPQQEKDPSDETKFEDVDLNSSTDTYYKFLQPKPDNENDRVEKGYKAAQEEIAISFLCELDKLQFCDKIPNESFI